MNAETSPNISLAQISVEGTGVAGVWRMVWRVHNHGAESLEITSVRLPHGQFRSDAQRFEPPITLGAGASEQFESSVRCAEPAGLVTENAFVILYANWLASGWRIYARIRVTVNSESQPETATVFITYQKAGFSGLDH
ncbi:MAG TPA: hypothetical protein VNT76_18940 [Candidatus Binatus sp.]|nr:hypothetical protein [Candidatus Binatus sp.]